MPKSNNTQHQIATALNLSRATVSRCFTNHPGISPETRAKVFDLASRMGYSHLENAKPRAHSPKFRQLSIGTLVCVDLPSFENTRYDNPGQKILTGVTEYFRTVDTTIDLHYVRSEERDLTSESYHRIASSRRRRWKGVLLIYPFAQPVVDELLAIYPVVSLVEQYGSSSLNCVDVDHYRGISRLMDALIAAGHRRIGFFTWKYGVEASWALRRFSAYLEKLTSVGFPIRLEDAIMAKGPEEKFVVEARETLLQRTREGVTAWICAADHQAYDLIAWLETQGLKVPKDVSITGFDGITPPAGAPLLSTIEIPFRQIGITGAKRLSDMVHKRFDAPQHILLDCNLREGDTIAPPPKKKTSPSR